MPIPIYTIKNLNFSKGDKFQLHIKQFDIHRGACYVFTGCMGSGKTTLLDILYSQRSIKDGVINFEEKEIQSYSKREYMESVAVVPQIFYPKWGTVKKYIYKTIQSYSHVKKPEKHLNSIVKKMNLDKLLNRKMKSLTPGELRWILLAAKIAADTKVLFIDEYEQHLGKEDLNILSSILYRKVNYDGITLIATTRNQDLFNRLASVKITLENGRIISLRSFGKKREKYKKVIKRKA